MPFRFEWRDESRRVICYIAEGDWNWKDYHQAVRASTFTLSAVEHLVECLVDLRLSSRETMPAGLSAHLRSFGRKAQACLSGRAIVIGMGKDDLDALRLNADKTLPTADGFVQFVDNLDELERTLRDWQGDQSAG